MALQKRRLGRTRIHHRRSAWSRLSGENAPRVQGCPSCGEPKLPHRVCMSCGVYGGRQVVEMTTAGEE